MTQAVLCLTLLLAPQLPPPQKDCPARVIRLTIYNQTFRQSAYVTAAIQNNDQSRGIKSVEMQIDIIDNLRRTVADRIFVTLDDPGLGNRSIKPGAQKNLRADLDNFRLPEGVAAYGEMMCGTECLRHAVFNVIHFANGDTWERPGRRDEKR